MSSKGNKSAREILEFIYGKHCFIHQGIMKLNPPKPRKNKYRGKCIANQLTYHHIIPKSLGGKADLENGGLVCRSCHEWLEQLSEQKRRIVNEELIEYKRQIDIGKIPKISINIAEITTEGVQQVNVMNFEEFGEIEIIPAYDTTPEDREKYQKYLTERRKRELSKNKWKNSLKVETNPVNVQKILTEQQKKEQQKIFEDNLREMRY